MSNSSLYDLILFWSADSTDQDYSTLINSLENEFSGQFLVYPCTTQRQAIEQYEQRRKTSRPLIVITKLGTNAETSAEGLIKAIRRDEKSTFIIMHSHTASADANLRWTLASLGVNMITQSVLQVRGVLAKLLPLAQPDPQAKYSCAYCKWNPFTFEQLYVHVPLYHTNEDELSVKCEICRKSTPNFAVHLHEEHEQVRHHHPSAVPLYAFALVVCQRKSDKRFLVVQESASMGFWLPGGRVEVGEQLGVAAQRETLEEAGVKVRLTGILKIEFHPRRDCFRLRVIYFAEPLDENDCDAKNIPDYESYGAMWVTYDQVVQANTQQQLRGHEPLEWFKYVLQNGVIHPLSIL